MEIKIKNALKKIEIDHNIKILYACESGSRAWGFPSQDSDYDVRFIYIHSEEWYLSIDEKRDVIELPINDLLDISGWDLKKTLKLFRKSNPALLEWLRSDIVYYRNYTFTNRMIDLQEEIYSPIACLHHYHHMAKGNYCDFLQGELVKIKKYFYVLRPILACKWIEKHNSMPPILFQDLVEELISDRELKHIINSLLSRKISGDELNLEKRIDVLNEYIENEFETIESLFKMNRHKPIDPTDKLDHLFRTTLVEVWST